MFWGFPKRFLVFWTSDSDSSSSIVYIAGWKRLDPPQLGQQITKFSFETFVLKPDQGIKAL